MGKKDYVLTMAIIDLLLSKLKQYMRTKIVISIFPVSQIVQESNAENFCRLFYRSKTLYQLILGIKNTYLCNSASWMAVERKYSKISPKP